MHFVNNFHRLLFISLQILTDILKIVISHQKPRLLFSHCSSVNGLASVCLSEGVGWTLPQLNSPGRYCINLAHILVQCHLTISSVIHRLLFTETLLIPGMFYALYIFKSVIPTLPCLFSLLLWLLFHSYYQHDNNYWQHNDDHNSYSQQHSQYSSRYICWYCGCGNWKSNRINTIIYTVLTETLLWMFTQKVFTLPPALGILQQ